jgi:hypothetical protein
MNWTIARPAAPGHLYPRASRRTLRSPEEVTVKDPTPGTWNVLIQGLSVWTKRDNFQLTVILDGKPVKLDRSAVSSH